MIFRFGPRWQKVTYLGLAHTSSLTFTRRLVFQRVSLGCCKFYFYFLPSQIVSSCYNIQQNPVPLCTWLVGSKDLDSLALVACVGLV